MQNQVARMQSKAAQLKNTPANLKSGALSRANAMRSQLSSATRLTDAAFARDAVLRKMKVDALPAANGKSLRLVGTVSSAQEKMRAQRIAARNFKSVVNDIKVVPARKLRK